MSPKASRLVATCLGAGYGPIAPGSWGSLAALPFAAVSAWDWRVGAVLAAGLIAIGIPAATAVAREVGDDDPGIVVIDEAAGMTITALGAGLSIAALLTVFLSFRIFDVLKPFPCRRLERLPGGWGIVMDDVMAGVYAFGLVRLAERFLPGLY